MGGALQGTCAAVTGSSRDLDEAIVKRLAEAGAGAMVTFLASGPSTYVSGVCLTGDGAQSLR